VNNENLFEGFFAELFFFVEFLDYVQLNACKIKLENLYPSISISFLDKRLSYAN